MCASENSSGNRHPVTKRFGVHTLPPNVIRGFRADHRQSKLQMDSKSFLNNDSFSQAPHMKKCQEKINPNKSLDHWRISDPCELIHPHNMKVQTGPGTPKDQD